VVCLHLVSHLASVQNYFILNEIMRKSTITINPPVDHWFNYSVTVFPHHTDYASLVWHGTYLKWLEEARIECLSSIGVSFADFISIGCNIVVIDVSLNYQKPLSLGDKAIVRSCLKTEGIKIIWEYKVESSDAQISYLTGTVTLLPIDIHKGKIMRKLPPTVQDALDKLLPKLNP
jgi:acyl-CoA thioester hydrolase